MDDVWRTISLKICFYIRPDRWWWADWIRIALGCGFVVWAASHCPDRRLATFWAVRSGVRFHRHGRLPDRRELPLPPADPGLTLPDALASGVAGDSRRLRAGRASLAVRQPAVAQRKLGRRAVAHLELGRDSLGIGNHDLAFPIGFRGCVSWFRQNAGHSDWLWRSTRNTFLATFGIMVFCNIIRLFLAFKTPPMEMLDIHPVSIAMYLYPAHSCFHYY